MDWPVLALAAAPGLVILVAGLVTILRPQGSDPAVSMRGGRLILLGLGLFVLGSTLVLAGEAATRGNPLVGAAMFAAFGPAIVLPLWFQRRLRPRA